MDAHEQLIKLSYVPGLKPVVREELQNHHLSVCDEGDDGDDALYVSWSPATLSAVLRLRSVARVYVVVRHAQYHPAYVARHKSLVSSLIDLVTKDSAQSFNTFTLHCAGSHSPEVRSIVAYVTEVYGMDERDEADLKIHIIKCGELWEVGVQATPRPLSMRNYKLVHMSGAMDPTIAYAVNAQCALETAQSYLNVCSGSATLLIEAGLAYPHLDRIVGFDHNKKHLSLSMQNIRQAGLITKIRVHEADLLDAPNLGTFDAITADLPFGMMIAKHEDLETLYRSFVSYAETALNPGGRLVVYTTQHELLTALLRPSSFSIVRSLSLKLITNANAYLRPKILVCVLQGSGGAFQG